MIWSGLFRRDLSFERRSYGMSLIDHSLIHILNSTRRVGPLCVMSPLVQEISSRAGDI